MKNFWLSLVWVCALAISANANAGVVYDIQNNKLVGANGIDINGELYSVTFGDSCSSMYGGCNSSLFDFTTQQGAVSALTALFAQVLVDNVNVNGTVYNFDSRPELVQSCNRGGFCEMWVPYQVSGSSVTSAWWVNTSGNDYVGSNAWTGAYSYGNGMDYMAFTNWEKMSANEIPEPASLVLVALGVAGLGFTRFKSKAA